MTDPKALLHALGAPVLALAADGRVLYCNRSAEQLLGWSGSELADKLFDELLAPGRGLALEPGQQALQVLAQAALTPLRVALAGRSSTPIEVELTLAALPPEAGAAWLASLTPPHRGHFLHGSTAPGSELDEGETFRTLFRHAPFGIFHVDSRGILVSCNDAFVELIGSSREALIGLDVLSLGGDETRNQIASDVAAALRGQQAQYEGLYRSATGGRESWVRAVFAPIRSLEGAVHGAMGFVEEVTERLRAEQALRDSEQSFRALAESAPLGIAVQQQGRLVYVNPALAAALGRPHGEELIGQELMQFVHPDSRAGFAAMLSELSSPGAPARLHEERLVRRDGALVYVELAAIQAHFQGDPALMVLLRDVTERRQIEARLSRSDRMASIGTLAAGVAHEINNPLVFTVMGLQLIERSIEKLRKRASPPSEADWEALKQNAGDALTGAHRVSAIVRDLRTFSRVGDEARKLVDVEAVLDSAINMSMSHIRQRAQLVRDYGKVSPVWAEEARLGQVFLNLLVNASQAIPEGSATQNTITARTRELPDHRICVEIEDTGAGIEPWKLERIFEPFWTDKPLGVGTGLGLSICHGIVSALRGEISVASQPGVGSTFSVVLPARVGQTPTESPKVAPPSDPPPGATKARILLIDDERRLGVTLGIGLRGRAELTSASSGREGLTHCLGDDRFDLILCDLMMPDLTGMEVYEEVAKARPELCSRFVFITGGAVTERARAFLDQPQIRRLEKPFGLEKVEALLAGPPPG